MITRDAVFTAAEQMTPDFAAELAHNASLFDAHAYIERKNMRLSVDSLIGILSMDLRRGDRVTLTTDGEDEAAAMDRICELLHG